MACGHPVAHGYAFCGQCGAATEVPRCRCGFVAAAGDRFCGRCGTDLNEALPDRAVHASAAEAAKAKRGGLPDLNRLVAEASADKSLASPERKVHVDQDDIRKMIAARRGKR